MWSVRRVSRRRRYRESPAVQANEHEYHPEPCAQRPSKARLPPGGIVKMLCERGCRRMNFGQQGAAGDDYRLCWFRPELQADWLATVGPLCLANLPVGPLLAAAVGHGDLQGGRTDGEGDTMSRGGAAVEIVSGSGGGHDHASMSKPVSRRFDSPSPVTEASVVSCMTRSRSTVPWSDSVPIKIGHYAL